MDVPLYYTSHISQLAVLTYIDLKSESVTNTLVTLQVHHLGEIRMIKTIGIFYDDEGSKVNNFCYFFQKKNHFCQSHIR